MRFLKESIPKDDPASCCLSEFIAQVTALDSIFIQRVITLFATLPFRGSSFPLFKFFRTSCCLALGAAGLYRIQSPGAS